MLILIFLFGCQLVLSDDCFDCAFLNRNGNDCVKFFDECGECLKGYEEVEVTEGSKPESKCMKIRKLVGTCYEDSDCRSNQYCFNNNCSDCWDCSLFKRFSNKGCAKQPYDCGPCLNGFKEELVTKDTSSKPCIKEKQASYSYHQQDKYETTSASVGIVAIVSTFCIVALFFVGFIFTFYRRNTEGRSIQSNAEEPMRREAEESPPPSYEQIHRVSSESEITTTVAERKERTCQAIVFRNPTASYYRQSSFPQHEDENDNADMVDEAPQDVDDEATMPSSWTPNASNSSVNQGDEELCSFSGIFTNATTETPAIQSAAVGVNLNNLGTDRQNSVNGGGVENLLLVNNAQQQSDETGETRL